jgi:hypothetical protein
MLFHITFPDKETSAQNIKVMFVQRPVKVTEKINALIRELY